MTAIPLVKRTIVVMLIVFLSLTFLAGCRDQSPRLRQLQTVPDRTHGSKQVILLIMDSLMDKPLQETIRKGNAPAFDFLMKNGRYSPSLVSSFPTMSVTIDSTLLTGTYPNRHRVPGLVWYDAKKQKIINYGTGVGEILKLGPIRVMNDSLMELNNTHLNPQIKTIHDQIAERGKTSASLNAFIYRGPIKHTLKLPNAVASMTPLPKEMQTHGPKWLSYGVLSQISPLNSTNTYLWNSYGFNDKFTAEELKYLIRERKLPDVTVAYFLNNDRTVHREGPDTTKGIEKSDKLLQDILNTFGSWENALKETTWIVLGDSGQTFIEQGRNNAVVDLRKLLGSYRVAKLNQPVSPEDQVVLGVNERMAYIYSLAPELPLLELAGALRKDKRIDLIAWKENGGIRVMSGQNDRQLFYRPGGKYRDPYDQTWTLQGDPRLLDLKVNPKGSNIEYRNFPDGLQRLYSSLHSHPGNFIVSTAKPDSEFVGESSPTHLGGGGHGSLHHQDSLVPLITAGTSSKPKYLRIVDLKDWILQLVGNR